MADKDVNINVRAEGADETQRKLEGVAGTTEEMGKKTEEAGRRGSTGLAAGAKNLAAYAASAVSATAIIGALTAAMKANSDAMRENAEIAEGQQQRLLRLQFMGDFFQQHPQAREEVRAYAEFGRRPAEEVADAWYNLRSKGGFLDDEAQQGILRESLELSRTDPDVNVEMLVDMFLLYAKKTGERDGNRIQNVIKQTMTEAGSDAKGVASQLPQFLPWGIAGGMTGAETAGLWAYATTEEGDPAKATTALGQVFKGLEGQWTPDKQRLMRRAGVNKKMSFMEKLEKLGQGDMSVTDLDVIAGSGGAMLSSLAKNIEPMKEAMARIVAVDRGDIDLTADAIADVFGSDEIARMEEDARLMEIQIQNLRAQDVRAMQYKQKRLRREVDMRQRGSSEGAIYLESVGMKANEFLGVPPDWIRDTVGTRNLREIHADPLNQGSSELPTTVNYNNNYDNSSHYHPVSGMREERGMGERFSQD
ncbi:MAG: hypothetical protein IH624_04960 [Phycisphaerae bacterium]|nr:hypothetical protein [Phycisphaerae bacterium]